MKRTRKLLSCCLAAAMSLSLMTAAIPASAAALEYGTVYDMDTLALESFRQNYVEAEKNSTTFEDPTDSSNTVWGMKPCSTGNGIIVADMDFSSGGERYLQIEMDIYRDTNAGAFQVIMYPQKNWNNGVEVLNLTGTNVDLKTVNGAKYELDKWYSYKLVLDTQTSEYMLWMKEQDSDTYRYLAEYTAAGQTFSAANGYRFRMGNSDTTGYTYVDNLKISAVSSYNKGVRYEFNDVEAKSAVPFFNFGVNCGAISWSQATFDGAQVLKGTLNASLDTQPYTADRIPDMDRLVIETRLGFDSEGGTTESAAANLPYQFGIIPVFENDSGVKNVGYHQFRTNGIIFNSNRYLNIEGYGPNKNADGDTKYGYNLADGKLYTAGYVYDRVNKVYKAYFVTNHGETIVKDASSNAYVQAQKNLAGVQLWFRSGTANWTGKGYYDYLYIEEPASFVSTGITPVKYNNAVSVTPEIKIDYNNIIDPEQLANVGVTMKDSAGNVVEASVVRTYNGKTLIVKPDAALDYGKTYTVAVCGVKDLLGQEAASVDTTFTTVERISFSDIILNDGLALTDGANTIKTTAVSNDGTETDVALIAGLYDTTTEELLTAFVEKDTIAAEDETELTLDFNTTGYSNYKLRVFVWSGFGTMKPYIPAKEYTK